MKKTLRDIDDVEYSYKQLVKDLKWILRALAVIGFLVALKFLQLKSQ